MSFVSMSVSLHKTRSLYLLIYVGGGWNCCQLENSPQHEVILFASFGFGFCGNYYMFRLGCKR